MTNFIDSYNRGLEYLERKQKKGGYDKVIKKAKEPSTSELMADEYNVSRATIERDAMFARGLDKMHPFLCGNRAIQLLQGKTKARKSDIEKIGQDHIGKDVITGYVDYINGGEKVHIPAKPKANHGSQRKAKFAGFVTMIRYTLECFSE